MKKILFIGLGMFFALTSCNGDKKAPQAAQAALEKLYPGISDVDWGKENDSTWEAEFKNNGIATSVTYSNNGELQEVEEEISLSEFPQAAQDYLTQNYPNDKITEVAKITDKEGAVMYEAEINKKDLIFDDLGVLIKGNNEKDKEVTADNTSNKVSGKVDINALPQSINDFVTKNYAGYKIKSAAHDPMCNGDDALDVAITKTGSPAYSLIFSPQGEFIQQEEDVNISNAPAKVLETLKTKFGDYKIGQQIEKLSLADHSTHYSVDVSKSGASKEVIFDEQGNVLCED